MTGSRPRPPTAIRRPRVAKPLMPWLLIGILFVLYVLIGLMLSVPAPPYWVWIPAILGTLMLIIGLIRPLVPYKPSGQAGLLTYLGGLLLVISLATAANYVGSEQSFDNIRFLVALVSLVGLTLLAVLLTAAAAIISAQIGAKLMRIIDYRRSLSVLLTTCFSGIFLGGLAGFLTLSLTASN
ncbi:MAG: hypothetical protein WBB01_15810 [Phormidesmis sp.]